MTDIRAVAIRFADLWAVDPHQMADETYAPSIHMESMARLGRAIDGIEALHRVEDGLADLIPEHRHELLRVVVDPPRAFLETTVVGPTTGEYAQAAVWWRLDGAGPSGIGRVVHEVGWFDWEHRSTDSGRSRGAIPADDRRPRGDATWYLDFIHGLVAAWAADPVGAVERCLAPEGTLTHVGFGEWPGRQAVQRLVADITADRPPWQLEIDEVLGEGGVVATLVTFGDGVRHTRGTLVITLDAADAISSVRVYLDWTKASPRRGLA